MKSKTKLLAGGVAIVAILAVTTGPASAQSTTTTDRRADVT